MKLSEAIRKGAALRPQAVDDFAVVDETGQVCTCALGAAYEGITGHPPPLQYNAKEEQDIRNLIMDATGVKLAIYSIVMERNDYDNQTREEIAAWLEGRGL